MLFTIISQAARTIYGFFHEHAFRSDSITDDFKKCIFPVFFPLCLWFIVYGLGLGFRVQGLRARV